MHTHVHTKGQFRVSSMFLGGGRRDEILEETLLDMGKIIQDSTPEVRIEFETQEF